MGGKGITRLWYPRKERVFRWCRNFSPRSSAVLRVSGGLYRLRFYRRDAEDRRGCGKLRHYCFYCFFLGRAGIVTVRFSLFRVTSNVNIALWLAAGDRNGRRETPWPLMD